MGDAPGIKEILANVRPKTTTVRVCMRGDLLAQHQELERELAEARRGDATINRLPQARAVAERIQALEDEIEVTLVEFTFQSVGQRAWTDLLTEHPPTPEQRAQWREEGVFGYQFNPDTFPIPAVAASCVSPRMTEKEASALFDACNFGQWEQLWGAVMDCNVVGTQAPFSAAASVVLSGSEMKSAERIATESPAQSS